MDLKVGDIVSLKSDEHAKFTIGYISHDKSIVRLWWYDHNLKELKSKEVPPHIIEN